ncbi:hypothetical protein [Streptomyces sp. VRA16 Mangrove soil]|uniref:hypothetical protein n=1 Tax=Streptomyces sp. VRA16 Mangrove soil TaxID=2817434 RepID=UPI001A9E0BCF|nr:hypothetical protein [Streptomyces sp. VRA16 Mangrove soil]MBO1330237.1 hypothetical protein [Streptomyces sp. VRA16 Mangrove soil]
MTQPAPRGPRAALVIVSGVRGVFWGTWSALLPAVLARVHATTGELGLGLALTAVPLGGDARDGGGGPVRRRP